MENLTQEEKNLQIKQEDKKNPTKRPQWIIRSWHIRQTNISLLEKMLAFFMLFSVPYRQVWIWVLSKKKKSNYSIYFIFSKQGPLVVSEMEHCHE